MKILNSSDEETKHLIAICKSDSGVTGAVLRNAHRRLGNKIAEMIVEDYNARGATVICLMRAGLFFGWGIADIVDGPVMLTYQNDISSDRLPSYLAENGEIIHGKTVIIADAVINSGKTMRSISMDLGKFSEKLIIATNVIQSESVEKFTGTPLYASRVSENKFIGYRMKKQNCNRGPDTGDRLFKLM